MNLGNYYTYVITGSAGGGYRLQKVGNMNIEEHGESYGVVIAIDDDVAFEGTELPCGWCSTPVAANVRQFLLPETARTVVALRIQGSTRNSTWNCGTLQIFLPSRDDDSMESSIFIGSR